MNYRKVLPLIEVGFVLGVFLALSKIAQAVGFRRWEQAHLGFRCISDTTVYFLVPVGALVLFGRQICDYGFRTTNPGYHLRIALRAVMVLGVVCFAFPVMSLLGTAYDKWLGSIILTIAFLLGTVAFLVWVRRVPAGAAGAANRIELPRFVAFLAICFVVSWALHGVSQKAAKVLYWFAFVGCLQEALFRGYVQSRLNDVFGRPYSIAGVCFGPGLIICSVLFGHFHLLDPGAQYPWAICTTASGLFFGLIREKTGSIIASAFAHGLFLVPDAIFG
ncbi:MAG: lysostaphin resistance A-like protein [Planctomycetota bacterium]|jgi:membrane protease YdiL (CAAX protease family)